MTFPCEKYGRVHLGVNCLDCALVEAVEQRVREKYGYTERMVDALCDDADGNGYERGRTEGYAEGYGAAMDDGWGEPGHIEAAVGEERQRILDGVMNFYSVAPKAAEFMVRIIIEGWDGKHERVINKLNIREISIDTCE